MKNFLFYFLASNINEYYFADMETVGSVSSCEMLFRTNILAVIPGGSRPKIPENILHIYDDIQKKTVMEIKFASAVKAVRLRRDR